MREEWAMVVWNEACARTGAYIDMLQQDEIEEAGLIFYRT
jgi:hypothetical protein